MVLIGFLEKAIEQYSLSEKFKCLLRLSFYFRFIISAKAFEKKIYGNAILGKIKILMNKLFVFLNSFLIFLSVSYFATFMQIGIIINNYPTSSRNCKYFMSKWSTLRKTFFIYLLWLFYYYGLWLFLYLQGQFYSIDKKKNIRFEKYFCSKRIFFQCQFSIDIKMNILKIIFILFFREC